MIDSEVRSPEKQQLVDAYAAGELTRAELSYLWILEGDRKRLEADKASAVAGAVAWLRR